MASITASSGGTITANTIEAFFCGSIWLLQSLEADATRNPTSINNVTSTASDDSRSLTATINLTAQVSENADGNLILIPNDYLTLPSGQTAHYLAGSNGTISSATIQGALFEAARLIDKLENDSTKNQDGRKTVSWSVTNGDIGSGGLATITINVTNFPLTFSFNANGTQSLVGKAYLL